MEVDEAMSVCSSSFTQEEEAPEKDSLSKEERDLQRIRRRRRKANRTDRSLPIEGDLTTLDEQLQLCYKQLLTEKLSAIYCYQALLNSLRQFFAAAEVNDIEHEIHDALASLVRTSVQLRDSYENGEVDLPTHALELEVMCLFEFYQLMRHPVPLANTDIAKKLRFLYIASEPTRMSNFLSTTLCDEFFEELPLYLAGVHEELDIDIPTDLQRYESIEKRLEEAEEAETDYTDTVIQKVDNRLASEMEEMLLDMSSSVSSSDASGSSASTGHKIKHIAAKRRSSFASTSARNLAGDPDKLKELKLKPAPPASPQRSAARRRLITVPETPEEKLLQQNAPPRAIGASGTDEVVNPTPASKLRKTATKEGARLSLLLKETENRMSMSSKGSRRSVMSAASTPNTSIVESPGKAASVLLVENARKRYMGPTPSLLSERMRKKARVNLGAKLTALS
ncbi:hypothetical protein AAVH_08691 [Aphelenchoides avenae]|nr:hypothetical protein AAVH_08691 [Aphelenchus avenae]